LPKLRKVLERKKTGSMAQKDFMQGMFQVQERGMGIK